MEHDLTTDVSVPGPDRFPRLDPALPQYAVIGYPIGHSLSPVMHTAAFRALNIQASYVALEVQPGDLGEFVSSMRRDPWRGANVTVPFKEVVLDLVDDLADSARAIRAVNTVVARDGRLTGHNTDARGFLRALTDDAGFNAAGAKALIVGAGGAAKAVVYGLLQAGICKIVIANRDVARAERLRDAFDDGTRISVLPTGELGESEKDVDLLVNATSIGMSGGPAPESSPLPDGWLPNRALVYDLIYRPAATPLLRISRLAGLPILGGLPMLVYQGAESFELWTERPAPVNQMLAAVRSTLEEAAACFDS